MLHISCNIGTRDLPDMYALSPQALGIHIRQITRAYVTTVAYCYISLENLISGNTIPRFLSSHLSIVITLVALLHTMTDT